MQPSAFSSRALLPGLVFFFFHGAWHGSQVFFTACLPGVAELRLARAGLSVAEGLVIARQLANRRWPQLRYLDVSHNSLGADCVRHIGEAVDAASWLQQLKLRSVDACLGRRGKPSVVAVAAITAAIERSVALVEVDLAENSLSLAQTADGSSVLQTILDAVHRSQTLCVLDLTGNGVADEELKYIHNALQLNSEFCA